MREQATPGVGREGARLRLMGGAAIPPFPAGPGQARTLSDWDNKEMLRRILELPREVSDADFCEALPSRIEAKKKNFSISEDSGVNLPGSVRLEIKVLAADARYLVPMFGYPKFKSLALNGAGGHSEWGESMNSPEPFISVSP